MRQELMACGLVLFLTLGIRALLLPVFPPPDPAAHDEFSYLLAADTFASGRLANPPHPFWQHFETFHELMQPVYASKYPPLQGLVLALGQKVFGQPWAGVYLSAGLMCAAVCWMLQGWISPNLALLGALLFMLRIGIFSAWMNSYWGGAVAAIGGSLALGAMARIAFRGQTVHLITLALGFAILMNSRPWEGAVLAVAILAALAWHLRGKWKQLPLGTAAVSLAILLASFGTVAYVDYRITGNALVMPHALYDQQYIVAPLFAFQSLNPTPLYHNAVLRGAFTGWHVGLWRAAHFDFFNTALSAGSPISTTSLLRILAPARLRSPGLTLIGSTRIPSASTKSFTCCLAFLRRSPSFPSSIFNPTMPLPSSACSICAFCKHSPGSTTGDPPAGRWVGPSPCFS